CENGKNCKFAHEEKKESNLVCTYYLQGNCKFGKKCQLPHKKPSKEKELDSEISHSNSNKILSKPENRAKVGNSTVVPFSKDFTYAKMLKVNELPVDNSQNAKNYHTTDIFGDLEKNIEKLLWENEEEDSNCYKQSAYDSDHHYNYTNSFNNGSIPHYLTDSKIAVNATENEKNSNMQPNLLNNFNKSGAKETYSENGNVNSKFQKPISEKVNTTSKFQKHLTESLSLNNKQVKNSSNAEKDETLCLFAIQGYCRFGDRCRNLHGEQCPKCEKFCLHPTSKKLADGILLLTSIVDIIYFIEHLNQCTARIDLNMKDSIQKILNTQSEEILRSSKLKECCICYEYVLENKDPRFGLLNCEHCCCLSCIRSWRQNEGKGMNEIKSCPICRIVTHFIVPSNVWLEDPILKNAVIQEYKKKLRHTDCKWFNFGEGNCPFGSSCFYRHSDKLGNLEKKLRHIHDSNEEVKIIQQVRLSDFLG
ncbi:hypothetical protein HDU92_004445, partial [Lobulomyces angularis]